MCKWSNTTELHTSTLTQRAEFETSLSIEVAEWVITEVRVLVVKIFHTNIKISKRRTVQFGEINIVHGFKCLTNDVI